MTLVHDPSEPATATHTYGERVVETLAPRFRLTWLDQDLHDAPTGTTIKPYARTRDFKHLGGAIAWARRRIFHGHVFGDAIELAVVHRQRNNGAYQEDLNDVQDITLAGFWPWTQERSYSSPYHVVLSKPHKRCVFE